MENYIAIGDIHGRADLLQQLMENPEVFELFYKGTHKLVFMGDMVDRGPDSYVVVNKIKDMCEAGWAIALRGNHEDLMLRYFDGRVPSSYDIWMPNGGTKTIGSYCKAMGLDHNLSNFFTAFEQSGHDKWIRSLPYYYETEKVWFSHAPVPIRAFRRTEDFRTDVHALTWSYHGKHDISESHYASDHKKLAVCGHVHALEDGIVEPRIYHHIIYADTGSGCAPHGRLTGIIITDGEYKGFVQAVP